MQPWVTPMSYMTQQSTRLQFPFLRETNTSAVVFSHPYHVIDTT